MHTPADASLTPRLAVRGLLALILLVFSAPLCAAATLYVSPTGDDNNAGTKAAPYKTIQAAVNNANAGDTITLHAGTYTGNGNRDIDFAGKSLTVNSDSGASRTVIDCGGTEAENHRAFYFHSKEQGARIEGLTIKNGLTNNQVGGGAVCIENVCDVDFARCTFTGNGMEFRYGGSIWSAGQVKLTECTFVDNPCGGFDNQGKAIVSGCTFKGNTGLRGAGINSHGALTLTDSSFVNNTCEQEGGGLNAGSNGSSTVTRCTFIGNHAAGGGGVSTGEATLTDCTFNDNTAVYGGGLENGNDATVIGCTFQNNHAESGAGVYNSYNLTLTNCAIVGNNATDGNGGGVRNSGTLTMRFCSIGGNSASGTGEQGKVKLGNDNAGHAPQGAGLENDGKAVLTDDIFWGNTSSYAAEIGTPANGGQTTNVTYCDIQGGLSGTGNIKVAPGFMDAADGNLHLQAGSPCRGAGIRIGPVKADPSQYNSQPDPGVSTDADGLHRPNPPSIGAYEYTAIPKPVRKLPLLDLGGLPGGNVPPAPGTTAAAGAAVAPGTAGGPTPNVVAASPVAAPAVPQARPVLGPGEQKQANDEFLHLMVSLDTNTLSHDEMTRQIQGELAKGAQIDARDGEGFPAIVTAASLKRTDVVQVLLELGADPNALTVQVSSSDASANDDSSVLHKTANGYQVNVGAVVSSIFGHKPKPKPVYGQSALMFAAQNGTADMVTLLLNAKVVVNMRDSRGKSALDYAGDAHHDDIVATLKARGAG